MNTGLLRRYTLLVIVLVAFLNGCAGVQTFPNAVRAGDTAALAAGWKSDFSRNNIIVSITDSSGSQITYLPGDPAIRAVVNFYPDPLSGVVVSDRSGIDLTPNAGNYATAINYGYTQQDRDWWQTVAFVDLPNTISPGTASITITNSAGASAMSTVQIIEGTGTPTIFNVEGNWPLQNTHLAALERVSHYEVTFNGNTTPHALELRFSHAADIDHGGNGRAHVVNPRGEIKNLMWSDDGRNLHVILTPVGLNAPQQLIDYKFYVTGGITGLQLQNVTAFDANGNNVAGITASLRLKQ